MIKLVLPYPVSANRYWRSFAHPHTHRVVTVVSSEAQSYKSEVGWLAKEAGLRTPLDGPVMLVIRLVPKNKVCMDLDNALKVLIDALKGIAYADDGQVTRILARKHPPSGSKSRLEVEIDLDDGVY